jgi:hypothetical protein
MTKDKNVYTTPLKVVMDPRSKATLLERQAQYNLAMQVYALLGTMTKDVERINAVRLALEDRVGKTSDANLQGRLRAASAAVDALRKKIVATKEGGAITGEERLREFVATLYGDVTGYEGRPSRTQMERADALARELTDVRQSFDKWLETELPKINTDLSAFRIEAIPAPGK